MPSALDLGATAVLACYPSFCRQATPLPLDHGGFSGTALWHIDGSAGSFCLRAWPPAESWERMRFRHRLMVTARRAGLLFVPTVFAALDGATAIERGGRLWDVTEWMPGRADFHQHPSSSRLETAAGTLAQLHAVWRSVPCERTGPCAVQRRLSLLEEWQHLLRSGWRPRWETADEQLRPLAQRAWRLLPSALEGVPRLLQRWRDDAPRLQPCLCDLWHDNVLFDGDRLGGLIDYGAVKVDRVAVDVARLLGSLVKDAADGWRCGLQAYRRYASFSADDEELARVLDRTGVALGAANWLRWLYQEHRSFADRNAVARRLAELVERLQGEPAG